MNKIILTAFTLLILTSCAKQEHNKLIGIWVSVKDTMQFTIQNTDGLGGFVNFKKEGSDFNVNIGNQKWKYKIKSLNTFVLVLTDSTKRIYVLNRVE